MAQDLLGHEPKQTFSLRKLIILGILLPESW